MKAKGIVVNILCIMNKAPGDLTFGGGQRVTLLYNALLAVGNVYCIHFGDSKRDNERIISLGKSGVSTKGWRHYVNAVWRRVYCFLVPKFQNDPPIWMPFPYNVDIEKLFPGVAFDYVVCRHYRDIGRTHSWDLAPLFVDLDDHPLQVFETVFAKKMSFLRLVLARRLLRFCISQVERNVTSGWVAREDQIKTVSFRLPPLVLPNIPLFPPQTYKADSERAEYVFTIACLGYLPNVEGIDLFLRNIWPRLRMAHPHLEYRIVGGHLAPEIASRWNRIEGVKVVGFVNEVSESYRGAIASVVPVNSGSGTCIKTLESMAHSRVCLATPFGARGILDSDLADGRAGVLVYHDADEFLGLFERILSDVSWRMKLENAGRKYAQDNYSPESFVRQVARMFENLPEKGMRNEV